MRRQKVTKSVTLDVLTEAGYRCAVPTCRSILALDLHHLVQVVEGGGNNCSNLIALCPTCHRLFHMGVITRESLYSYKGLLVALARAFDSHTVDDLLFLARTNAGSLKVSGDGVLRFSRLIAADLAYFSLFMQNGPLLLYEVGLTQKGRLVVDAWKSGNREAVEKALGASKPSHDLRR